MSNPTKHAIIAFCNLFILLIRINSKINFQKILSCKCYLARQYLIARLVLAVVLATFMVAITLVLATFVVATALTFVVAACAVTFVSAALMLLFAACSSVFAASFFCVLGVVASGHAECESSSNHSG